MPWLRDHVEISERTAQLYMRLAKNRAELEANPQPIADLTLNEAAAVLALSSNVKDLFAFFNRTADMEPEELVAYCATNDVAVYTTDEIDKRFFVNWATPQVHSFVRPRHRSFFRPGRRFLEPPRAGAVKAGRIWGDRKARP